MATEHEAAFAASTVLFSEAEDAKETLIQHPETGDFLRGALVEGAYQRERWSSQDAAKTDQDWFWTLGYIIGKSIRPGVPDELRLHEIEAAAGLLANWHHVVSERIHTYAAEHDEPEAHTVHGGTQ